MLEKLKSKFPRRDWLRLDRARIDVARHRLKSRLSGRRRHLVAMALALALVGVVTLTNVAATGNEPSPASIDSQQRAAVDSALTDRQSAAERADRFQRSVPDFLTEGRARAAGPEESPTPAPEPTESEPKESEPEPAKAEEPKPKPKPEPEPEETAKPDWVHPMPGARTTSCYGMRWGSLHAGVDLAAPHGTPILAVGAGTVTHAGWVFGGYGISVVIDHGDGILTHYAHASEAKVSVGQRVSPGQTIALEGSTGDSTGPHLHFEVHRGLWNQIEPTSWMRDRGVTIGGC